MKSPVPWLIDWSKSLEPNFHLGLWAMYSWSTSSRTSRTRRHLNWPMRKSTTRVSRSWIGFAMIWPLSLTVSTLKCICSSCSELPAYTKFRGTCQGSRKYSRGPLTLQRTFPCPERLSQMKNSREYPLFLPGRITSWSFTWIMMWIRL